MRQTYRRTDMDRSVWINLFIKLINVIAVSCLEDCSKILLRTHTLRCINTRCGVYCTALLHNYLPMESLAYSQALQNQWYFVLTKYIQLVSSIITSPTTYYYYYIILWALIAMVMVVVNRCLYCLHINISNFSISVQSYSSGIHAHRNTLNVQWVMSHMWCVW